MRNVFFTQEYDNTNFYLDGLYIEGIVYQPEVATIVTQNLKYLSSGSHLDSSIVTHTQSISVRFKILIEDSLYYDIDHMLEAHEYRYQIYSRVPTILGAGNVLCSLYDLRWISTLKDTNSSAPGYILTYNVAKIVNFPSELTPNTKYSLARELLNIRIGQ